MTTSCSFDVALISQNRSRGGKETISSFPFYSSLLQIQTTWWLSSTQSLYVEMRPQYSLHLTFLRPERQSSVRKHLPGCFHNCQMWFLCILPRGKTHHNVLFLASKFWNAVVRWNILNTRKNVSSNIQTLRSGASRVFFFANFEVFAYLMKHSFESLI